MYNVLEFIFIITGVYLMNAGRVMKTEGKINANVALSKGVDENAIRDKEGFIQYMSGRLVLIGAVCTLAGIVNLLCDFQGGNAFVSLLSRVVFVAALVVYGIVANKALKKYTR